MIATLFKALIVVGVVAVVATHGPSDLRPVKKAAVQAHSAVAQHVHAASAHVSRVWARLKRTKPVERIEKILSLDAPNPGPPERGPYVQGPGAQRL
jgi:hypothetical protein